MRNREKKDYISPMTQFELASIESYQITCFMMIDQAHCPALSAPTPTSPPHTQITSPTVRRATPMKVQTLVPTCFSWHAPCHNHCHTLPFPAS